MATRTYHFGMVVGYVLLGFFAVVAVWFVIHLRRTPPMPGRRPFDPDESGSLIGEERKPTMPWNPPPGPGGSGGI